MHKIRSKQGHKLTELLLSNADLVRRTSWIILNDRQIRSKQGHELTELCSSRTQIWFVEPFEMITKFARDKDTN